MSTLIVWEEPQAVIDFEWRNTYAPEIKILLRTCILTTLVLSVPSLTAVFLWARFALNITLWGLFGTGAMLPVSLSLPTWLYKFGRRCKIGEKVLSKSFGKANYFLSGYENHPFKWKQIQKYEFADHPDLPQIRRLIFSLKGSRRNVIFNFSPEEVDEQYFQAILNKHLTCRN